jgi:DNA-binding NtrC family response regulator
MDEKKKDKRLANATAKWEKEQLQAAMAAEQIDKAVATIMQYKDELTEEQLKDVLEQTRVKKAELEEFLIAARNKYAAKLDELNLEAVVHSDEKPVIVNLEDL